MRDFDFDIRSDTSSNRGPTLYGAPYTDHPACCHAENARSAPMPTQTDIAQLRDRVRQSTYCYEQIKFLSNNIGPRMSGSPQAAAAVAHVAQQMREMGLAVRLEPVAVQHWVRGSEKAELIRYPGQVEGANQKILITALGNSVPTPAQGITASVLVAHSFEELQQFSADQVKGRVVLFNHRFEDFAARAGRWDQAYAAAVQYRTHGAARAAKKGAVAVLVRSAGSGVFRLAHTGITRYEQGSPEIPAGAVPAEDADLISDLAKQGEVEVHIVLTPCSLGPVQSHNVIADLTGAEIPEQVVIVSAHLDSWDLGTGALDDATGAGIAMDAVRILKEAWPRPKATIRFVAWMDEENGGAGGRAYAADHESELHKHIAAVEIDYGDGRPLGLNVAGTDERVAPISEVLRAIAEPIGGVVRVSASPGVDLTEINERGVPAIAPLQEARHYFDYHHTAADTFDKVRIDELRRVVEVIALLAYALAQHN